MDLGLVFKIMNYIVMVIGGLMILICVAGIAGVGLAASGMDAVNQGGATFFTMLALLPMIAAGAISFLAGYAGLHSDPDRCKKCARIILILLAFSAVSALRSGSFGAANLIALLIYGSYCYLAHTQAY